MLGEQSMRNIANDVKQHVPEGFGFAVLVFPHGQGGISNYVSNSNREDMIQALRETADRLEGKQDFPTPNEN